MNASEITAIVLAAVAVITCIGSILLLAFRVGRLTGTIESRMSQGETERTRIWEAIGALVAKVDRHIETPHRIGAR